MIMLDPNKQKALNELLEALGKGIDLLANEHLDKDLYEAFEKYASSTIKLMDEAYLQNYTSYLSENFGYCMPRNNWISDYFNPTKNYISPFNQNYIPLPHSAISGYYTGREHNEYREKLKHLLQKLISIAKRVIYE